MKNLKIFCIGSNDTGNWMRGNICGSIEKADVVVFPGGADINPKLYGELPHTATMPDDNLDVRDTIQFAKALHMGKKMVGICRGAQFLCAKAGGKLVQNQSNSSYHHNIFTYDGQVVWVSSSHHQAMYPWGMKEADYNVLGWSIGQSHFHHGSSWNEELVNNKVPMNMEVEVAHFPKINALCIQGHPEWQYSQMSGNAFHKNTIEYFRMLMDKFMDGDQFKDAKNAYSIS